MERREYTYQGEVRGIHKDGSIHVVHYPGDVVEQIKVNGHWRDAETRIAKEAMQASSDA